MDDTLGSFVRKSLKVVPAMSEKVSTNSYFMRGWAPVRSGPTEK